MKITSKKLRHKYYFIADLNLGAKKKSFLPKPPNWMRQVKTWNFIYVHLQCHTKKQ